MSDKPIRIQRKRTKGWKMPKNTVYVGRPSRWGNPARFAINGRPAVAQQAVNVFWRRMQWLSKQPGDEFAKYITPLKGKNLACWCPLDQPCHADVLLEIANQENL